MNLIETSILGRIKKLELNVVNAVKVMKFLENRIEQLERKKVRQTEANMSYEARLAALEKKLK